MEGVSEERTTKYVRGKCPDPGMTWPEFSAMFHERWPSYAIHDNRKIEFDRLTQGIRSVTAYEQKFSQLVPYVPQYHGMESRKMKRFIRGIMPDIRKFVVTISDAIYWHVQPILS